MKLTVFQIIVLGVFVIFIIVGVGVFALLQSGSSHGVGTVVIWGTLEQSTMDPTLQALRNTDKSFQDVSYVQKDPTTYESDLIDAMASGQGPDLFLLPQDEMGVFGDKIDLIPYGAISQSTFVSSYIDEGQLFLRPQGILALPFFIDPLVMYWNRDLFETAGIAAPPQYWNTFLTVAPKITSIDAGQNITQSTIALGEWDNVMYAKEILTALMLQAGDPIVQLDPTGAPSVYFGTTPSGASESPAASALQFYTEFSDPSKTSYSWNRSLPNSQDAFVAGNLAVYLGFASDYTTLSPRNPNLNFGVAMLPQIQGNATHLTFGRLQGLAIARSASNPSGALVIAEKLTSQAGIGALFSILGLPPVRRDIEPDTSGNAAASVFEQSALIARGWYDPSPAFTTQLFQSMVESVISGQSDPIQAVDDASESLQQYLRKAQ